MSVARTRRVKPEGVIPEALAADLLGAPSKVNFPPPAEPARIAPPRAAEGPGPAWGMVVEDLHRLDVWSLYERLRDGLRQGDGYEYAGIVHALDRASQNLFDAYRLHAVAVAEAAREEREVSKEMELLRTVARAELAADQVLPDGTTQKRKGVVTKDEVSDRCLSAWPDQVRAMLAKKERAANAAKMMEGLIEAWRSRHRALEGKARRAADAAGR